MRNALRVRLALLLGVALLAFAAWARAAAPTAADNLLAHIEQATYVAEGRGPRLLYIFFDPNCPYCHGLYQNLRAWVGKDGLQIRWVPVGILTPTSEAKAAAILQAANPMAALHQDEDDFGFADYGDSGGGIAPAMQINAKTRQALAVNLSLMEAQHIYGVPVVLFRDRSGRGQVLVGAPSSPAEVKALLARIK
ncbi:MAG: thioredoxin fold domain-containing protein [Hyphomicrobiaceae bacterium]